MREALRTRYYCDFCKKTTAQKAAMVRHESGCTLNPNRKCRMCAKAEIEQQPLEKMIAAARIGLKELNDAASDNGHWPCPACMLAAIRQLRKIDPPKTTYTQPDGFAYPVADYYPGGAPDSLWNFKYKDEVKEFWNVYSE